MHYINDKMFYSEIETINGNDILVKGFENLGGGDYDDSTLTISPKSIPGIIDILDNYNGLMMLKIDQQFDNGVDNVKICIEGSDRNPCVTIFVKHYINNGSTKNGIIHIPYRPFDEESTFYYLRPFMEELKKFAK